MNSLIHPRGGLALAFLSCWSLASAQQPQILSLDSGGGQGNQGSSNPSVSADGRFVAFTSSATNLVPNDTNDRTDVFVRDTLLSTTTRVSISSTGLQSDGSCFNPVISSSGSQIEFVSTATNLAPFVQGFNEPAHVFVHDLQSGITEIASIDDQGNTPSVVTSATDMSGDGHQVLFLVDMTIGGSNLGPWYVRNLQTQTTTHLVTSNLPLAFSPRYLDGQFLGDGRWIAFTRQQSTVSGPTARVLIIDRDSDQNGVFDEPGTITRKIIEPSQGAPFTRIQSASRSGRFFTYQAAAFGVPGSALWLHDRDPDGDGVLDQPSSVPDTLVTDSFLLDVGSARAHQVSDDGRFVAFADQVMLSSGSTRIARVKDMQTGGVFLQGATFSTGDAAPIFGTPTISTDGSSVVVAVGTALIAGDVNGQLDVYSIPHDETVCEPVLYYGGANGNSVNPFGSEIRLLGSIRISLDNFTLQAIDVPNGPGQFFYGPEEASTPFGDGFRFVGAGQLGLFRLPIVHGVGNLATFHMPFGVPPASAGPGHITPGSTWNFQYVFRDPSAGTFGFNTSSAVRVTFCP